jgi:hypothetical protein
MAYTAAATAVDTQQQRNWHRLAHELMVSARHAISLCCAQPADELKFKTALTRRHPYHCLCPCARMLRQDHLETFFSAWQLARQERPAHPFFQRSAVTALFQGLARRLPPDKSE